MDPVVIALGLGAAIFLLSGKKKKSAAPPSPGPDQPEPQPGGGGRPSGGSSQPKESPSVPYPGQNTANERGQINTEHSIWLTAVASALGESGTSEPVSPGETPPKSYMQRARAIYDVPSNQTVVEFMADKAFKRMFPNVGKIPSASRQGSGWTGYINAWKRMADYAKTLQWTTSPGTGRNGA